MLLHYGRFMRPSSCPQYPASIFRHLIECHRSKAWTTQLALQVHAYTDLETEEEEEKSKCTQSRNC